MRVRMSSRAQFFDDMYRAQPRDESLGTAERLIKAARKVYIGGTGPSYLFDSL